MLRLVSHNKGCNKKGMTPYEGVMWIVRSFILVFILLSLIFVTNAFIVRKVDTRLSDSYVFMNLVYYHEKGISSVDVATGRVYPGTVAGANSNNLNDHFTYGEAGYIAARVTAPLSSGGTKEFHYNSEAFSDWNFLYLAGLTEGVGGVKKISAEKRMSVVDSGRAAGSNVKLEVVTKNV